MMKRFYPLAVTLLVVLHLSTRAADNAVVIPVNFTSFTNQEKVISEELLQITDESLRSNPDFGKLPVTAPCNNCYEDLSKRKADARYFFKNGSNGTHFYIQQSVGDINYKDIAGNWREINPNLQVPTVPGEYHAPYQPFPVTVDLNSKKTTLTNSGYTFEFNKSMELFHMDSKGTVTSLGTPNWSNQYAGDGGVKILDFYPGVDVEFIVYEGKVKANFLLNSKLNFTDGWIVARQGMSFTGDLKLNTAVSMKDEAGRLTGTIPVVNGHGLEIFSIGKSLVLDNNTESQARFIAGAEVTPSNDFLIYVPVSWLNNPALVYPVTIDPLVSATGSMATPAITGSMYSACYTGGCVYNMPSIAAPPKSTITNIQTTFTYNASNACQLKDGGIIVHYGACRAPGTMAFSNPTGAAGNATINATLFPYFSSCIPAPQCATYNMDFSMDFYRCVDQTAGCASTCISANSPWVVTVEGHTVEINSITPSHIVCTGGNTSLTATAQYGVGGYSYSWTPGGAGQTINPSPAGTQVYTCTVTDACANTATNSVTVTVTGSAPPAVTISPNGTVCAGTNITFTATPNNGGASPTFDWYIGSLLQQTGPLNTFQTTVSAFDSISVQMTSTSACASTPIAFAGFTIANTPVASVALNSVPSAPPYCVGQTVVFTAVPAAGSVGANPVYGWGIGAAQSGIFLWTTSNTYTYVVQPGVKVFKVWLVSDLPCVTNDTVGSVTRSVSGTASVTPIVTVSPTPVTACVGDVINFTSLTTFGGAGPLYQWQLDGVDIGGATTNAYNYTAALPAGSHVISLILTSNQNCAIPATDTAFVPVTVSANSAPSVTITHDWPGPGQPCAGQQITFTANPTNGGTAPTYVWEINGVNAGTGSTLTTTALLGPNDSVSVVMTSNSACATSPTASNYIIFPVTPAVTPLVTINTIPASTLNLCANDPIQFFTNANNGGTPTFQWQENGVDVPGATSGSYSSSYSTSTIVSVIMTSTAACAVPATDTAFNPVTINAPQVPSVSLAQAPAGAFCQGTSITFTPTPINGGTPTYQWYVNGTFAFVGDPFVTTSLSNGDVVKVRMTATGCVDPDSAVDQITVTVNPLNTPTVALTQTNPPPCQGTPITFNAHTTLGGTAPTFNWWVNGSPVVVPDSVFTSSSVNPGDLIRVTLHSNIGCPDPDTAFATVNAAIVPTLIPSVNISQSPDPACLGTPATFTATPVNGGAAPVYQWTVNSVVVGGTGSTYTTSTLNSGDVVGVTLTSNAQCASPATASNTFNANLTIPDVPVVTITPPTTGNIVCQGATANFTATATAFGGTSPTYQWFVNGTAVSSSNPFSTTTLADNDVVSVVMTSNASCVSPVTDTDAVTMDVIPLVVPSVTLTANPNDSICGGDLASFTIDTLNAGPNPQYQWYNNAIAIPGATGNTYSSSTLTNGNVISIVLISDALCALPVSDTDRVTMTVTTNVPSVTIAAVPVGSVCEGASVVFTATPVNGGTAPIYQWFEGGSSVGINSATYTSTTLTNGAQVTVQMTSNAYCASPTQVTSNAFTANVVLYQTPTVTITANPAGTICVGNPVTFTAVATFPGPGPIYQWQVNGVNKGTNSATFTSSTLADGDVVQVLLTSNYQCLNTPNATSNQIIIDAAQPLQVTISGGDISVCPGVPVPLLATATGGLAPYGYTWTQNAGNDSAVVIAPLTTTSYIVTVTDVCGSTAAKDTTLITVYPSPAANFSYSPQNPSNLAPEVFFTDLSFQAVNWWWDFGDTTNDVSQHPSHVYAGTGYYQVQLTVENTFSCLDSITYTILVKEEVAMYIPNSFTPDGDGLNDLFGPMGFELGPYAMIIFDRWGQKVFEGSNDKPWDGKLSDGKSPAPQGVYVYYIYFADGKYNEPVVVGRVTVAN